MTKHFTDITADELRAQLASLEEDMLAEQSTFDQAPEIDRQRTERKAELTRTINELKATLATHESELAELVSKGSVRQEFIAAVRRFEDRIFAIATGTFNHLLERNAQKQYRAPYRELPESLKEGIRFVVNRLGFRAYTLPTFARLHRLPDDQISNALLESTMERVHDGACKLEEVLEEKKGK